MQLNLGDIDKLVLMIRLVTVERNFPIKELYFKSQTKRASIVFERRDTDKDLVMSLLNPDSEPKCCEYMAHA